MRFGNARVAENTEFSEAEQIPMSYTFSRDRRSAVRGTEAIRSALAGNAQHELDFYTPPALAMETGLTTYPAASFRPQRVTKPAAVLAEAPRSLAFQGLDVLTAQRGRRSNLVSVAVHILVVAAVLFIGLRAPKTMIQPATTVTHVDFTLYAPPPPPKVMPVAKTVGGGGGGGAHEIIEPTKGQPPKVARVQMLAPQLARLENPKLALEPTTQVQIPDSNAPAHLGAPDSPQVVLASQGMGSGSGFGHGLGGGIGIGRGSGAGPGTGGGYGGGVMSVGGGVSAPQLIHSVEPEFTPEARQANYGGSVAIQLIVDAQGNPQDVHVTRRLGMGLEQKAIEAVRQYRFKPAMYQGHPVAVEMVVEVEFHLH